MPVNSMTGYGSASVELPGWLLSIELRSVNHRYADVRLRLPAELAAEEATLRRRVLGRIRRGRVELGVRLEPLPDAAGARLNRSLVDALLRAAEELRETYGLTGAPDVTAVLRVPGVLAADAERPEWGEHEHEALVGVLDRAIEALDTERRREGEHLREELAGRLGTMVGLVEGVRRRAGALPERLRRRLTERLAALGADLELDPARVAQEAVLLADRADVTEEIVRLAGHLEAARGLVERPDGEPVGKRLDFLVQEIQREANTINSKAGDLELSRHALELKAEAEKVREQVQNLE